jgi:hypothetical protein
MKRFAIFAGLAGAVFLGLWIAVATTGVRVMPSYLAAWVFCLALPAGALPLVMAAELSGIEGATVSALRGLLVLMPAAAIAAVPILTALPKLYGWEGGAQDGPWFTPVAVSIRVVVALGLWSLLALLLLRETRQPRRLLCIAGLTLHPFLATMVASDIVLSLGNHMSAAGFGFLFMIDQCVIAVSAALLLAPAAPAGILLAALLSAWGFLHFIQYLVIWSADKPAEITWYLQRGGVWGQAAVWFSVVALLPVSLLAWRQKTASTLALTAASIVLATHALEVLWLVTPSVRGSFFLSPADLFALLGLTLLCAALLLARTPDLPKPI